MGDGHFAGHGVTCEKFTGRGIDQRGEFLPSFAQGGDLGHPDGISVHLFFENIESQTHILSGEDAAIRFSRRKAAWGQCSGAR